MLHDPVPVRAYARRVPALTAADTTGTYSAKVGTAAGLRDGGQVRRGQAHPLQQHQRRLHGRLPGGVRVHGGHGRLPSPTERGVRPQRLVDDREGVRGQRVPGREDRQQHLVTGRSPQRRRSAAGITMYGLTPW